MLLSQFIPWDIEKITRQYIGFNDLVIQEYHDTLKLFPGTNTIANAKLRPLFQWRYPTSTPEPKQQYIYNTRIYFDKALSLTQLRDRIPLYNKSSIKINYKY